MEALEALLRRALDAGHPGIDAAGVEVRGPAAGSCGGCFLCAVYTTLYKQHTKNNPHNASRHPPRCDELAAPPLPRCAHGGAAHAAVHDAMRAPPRPELRAQLTLN